MEVEWDLSEFVNYLTPQMATKHMVDRVIDKRKKMKYTQKDLSKRSGVSYASIRRFETTGEISLRSLMLIAVVLDCLKDFEQLFAGETITNLKDC